ncbi:hypothetical protein F511_38466 [Dorcoceras hygrometricum]|uniref:Uncharacterized protein n=1 Tax=Dorcoceras hygrometricum TaxID=472368 RepID=A0A2Z7BR68_9LAMI|nr:hypothetical protein F511_38466 [Dorcoceras hygrometricum]
MVASFSVNAMQVDFASVLAMEHTGMVRMFMSLEETRLNGFLEVSISVFYGAVTEFFTNSKVIGGKILSFVANRKMVITKDIFVEAFGLPTEGIVSIIDLPAPIFAKMRMRFFWYGCAVYGTKQEERNEDKKAKASPKRKKVVESSDSKSKMSLPLMKIMKKQRTQRTKPAQRTAGDQARFNPGSIPDIQAGADDASTSGGPKANMKTTSEWRDMLIMLPQLLTRKSIKGIFAPVEIREINWATHFLTKIDPAAKGKEILETFARPNPVEEHCLMVLKSYWEDVSSKMCNYYKWIHFRTAVRLNNVTAITPIEILAKIEDQFLFWAETELVSELFELRISVLYKLYEMETKIDGLETSLVRFFADS